MISLIPEWRHGLKLWSVRLQLIGLALLGFFAQFPDVALDAWNMLPADIKALLPETFVRWFGFVFLVASPIARFIKQSNIVRPAEAGAEKDDSQ